MRISDWSSDVCSSDLRIHHAAQDRVRRVVMDIYQPQCFPSENGNRAVAHRAPPLYMERGPGRVFFILTDAVGKAAWVTERALRSEEHTSELQSLMRLSYAVFCLKKKQHITKINM